MKTITPVKQPALPAFRTTARSAFTLIELLVVIAIIAILAGVGFPAFIGALMRANQTAAMGSARNISLALKMYANDHGGYYPSYTLDANGSPTTTPVSSSNDAFCQLFPNYIHSEKTFWVPKSAFCSSAKPDEKMDSTPTVPSVQTLKSGENEWAYVLAMNDNADPEAPLFADGFNDPVNHTYVKNPNDKGGVWKATGAIVMHCDGSGSLELLTGNGQTYTIIGPNGGDNPGDIFSTANAANGWLGTMNTVVNPK